MTQKHSEDAIKTAREVLDQLGDFDEIEPEVHYPVSVPEDRALGEFDCIGYQDNYVHILEVKASLNNLAYGFKQLERGLSHLESQGYDAVGNILVLNPSLASLNKALPELDDFYTDNELHEEWENSNVNAAVGSSVTSDLNTLTEEFVQPEPIPEYDWELLEEQGFVQETSRGLTSSGSLNGYVHRENGRVLHTSPRIEYLVHPSDDLEEVTGASLQ